MFQILVQRRLQRRLSYDWTLVTSIDARDDGRSKAVGDLAGLRLTLSAPSLMLGAKRRAILKIVTRLE